MKWPQLILAFGGNVTVSPNASVLDTAIAFDGDVILKKELHLTIKT
ncbi:hypothetical protein [Crocosphaera sp. XPORK-15E]|nr:hypothetical protein [Crocosphaera sp. XPORK-15E]MEA5534673.1 hypothetical protein [Crocosphaera sp. XPORK-15E]